MVPLFVYDDGNPIPFSVEMNQGSLGARIQQHGGRLTSAFEARFHIVGLVGAIMPLMDPTVLVLRARWVADSIRERRMLPIYPYLKNPDQGSLTCLSLEDRDVAELLKAKIGNHGDGVFDQLHTRLPHITTDGWRNLYQNSQVVIQLALARIVSPNQEQLNRLILPLFPHPAIPARQRPRRGMDIRDQRDAARAPNEDQDDVMEEGEYSDGMDSDEGTNSESIAQPPSTSASAIVDQQPVVLNFIEEDGGDGEPTKEDSGAESVDNGRPVSPSEMRQLRQRNGEFIPTVENKIKRVLVKYTQADYDAMVRFISELGHKPGDADWRTFWSLTDNNQRRSAAAWKRKYHTRLEFFLAEVARVRAQGGE